MKDKRGYSLAEVLTASAIIILIIASVFGVFITAKAIYTQGIAELNLQRDANIILDRIIVGMKEGGSLYGLRSAKRFDLPAVTPSASEINFDGIDGVTRKYFLNGNNIIYENPNQIPSQRIVYTAPAGCAIILRFWQPSAYVDNKTVGIYVSIVQQLGDRTVSGSNSTYVNIRNLGYGT